MRNPENDITITNGTGFMVRKNPYELHLKLAAERQQVGSTFLIRQAFASAHALTEINMP